MPEKMKPKTIVRATTHPGDTRPNMPTAELESFARPEEKRPTTVSYPRTSNFELQLAWKGEDGPFTTKRADQEALAPLRHAVR